MAGYELDELFDILKQKKITTNKESVRRWLRQGKLKGTKGAGTRKNSWWVTKEELQRFLAERLPEDATAASRDVACSEAAKEQLREEGRNEILDLLARKNLWEGRRVFKKSIVREALNRIGNDEARAYIMNRIMQHKAGYATPGVLYLFNHFEFEGERLAFDQRFGLLDEQIIYPLVDYLRQEYVDPTRRVR